MIAYDLQCCNGHLFEGWFEDAAAYRTQEKKGLISCPVCSTKEISRRPSTFAIRSSGAVKPSASGSGNEVDLARLGKKIVDFVQNNFDDVGTDFAKEALKMHYGVSEPRNIRGTSSEEEENTLKKEGIEFFKVPMPAPPSDSDA